MKTPGRGSAGPFVSRRRLVQGMAVSAVVAGLSRVAKAQATPHTFSVGAVEVTVVSDGVMRLPLSFVLPKQDRPTVDALIADRGVSDGALVAQVNVVVLKTADRLVLVDAGGSQDFMPTLGGFSGRFEAAGFRPEDVTDVVVTHAHPDHLWGALDEFEESRFAKARIHMSIGERDFWMKPRLADTMPDALKGMAAGTQRRLKLLAAQISVARSGVEILPGVSFVDTRGHTPGHASVLVASGRQSLLVGGDALSSPIISFERPEWPWGPDLEPETAIATRKALLDRLATDRTPLLGYHLPWPGLGRVDRTGTGYRFLVA